VDAVGGIEFCRSLQLRRSKATTLMTVHAAVRYRNRRGMRRGNQFQRFALHSMVENRTNSLREWARDATDDQ
jgi:hypothetical protein